MEECKDGLIVLGSRSPRRYELLSQLVGVKRVHICPPLDSTESDFDNVLHLDDVTQHLGSIARTKLDDVVAQLKGQQDLIKVAAILTADTVIVGFDEAGQPRVLGQPPVDDTWTDIVREWFEEYLLRAPHLAMTALCVSSPQGHLTERIVTSRVTFSPDGGDWLDWYLRTGESQGKAGGYGLQGAGSLFVDRIEGSPSNVIGLPLKETAEVLRDMGITV